MYCPFPAKPAHATPCGSLAATTCALEADVTSQYGETHRLGIGPRLVFLLGIQAAANSPSSPV
jgi:hypothetical protein